MWRDKQKTQAVIFDMNGVIVMDEAFHIASWKEFCKRYHFTLTEEEFTHEVTGKRAKDTLNYLFQKTLTSTEIKKYADERDLIVQELIKDKLHLPEGLREALTGIKDHGLPLAIATSARRGYVDFIMETFKLRSFFPIIVTGDDVKNGKPDPEIYLKTAKKLKVKPKDCLVIEDSMSGIKSAKAAGMTVVAITSTHTREELEGKADFVIDSFLEN